MTKKRNFVVDTNIFIFLLRGNKKAKNLLNQINQPYISSVTAAELYAGAVTFQHRIAADKLLKRTFITDFSIQIAKQAAYLIRKHPEYFGKKTMHGVLDAFIVATGIYLKMPVLTLDRKHFSNLKTNKVKIIVIKQSAKKWGI